MSKHSEELDPFTGRRITKFVADFRSKSGQLPTLGDFGAGGFARALVESAVKAGLLEMRYVTLTNGSVVKGYKLRS